MLQRSKIFLFVLFCAAVALPVKAQDEGRWNFTVGGGPGFPQGNTSNFANTGGNFVIGGGMNFLRFLGVDAEYMYHSLPIKQSVLNALDAPGGSARQHSVTFNGIARLPLGGHLGVYAIGGIGYYHESGELTAPAVVPGTICTAFWVWWGYCVNGLIPTNVVLASHSANAFGENIGGGATFRLGESRAELYAEVRYHHAAYSRSSIDLLPLTFGFRW